MIDAYIVKSSAYNSNLFHVYLNCKASYISNYSSCYSNYFKIVMFSNSTID